MLIPITNLCHSMGKVRVFYRILFRKIMTLEIGAYNISSENSVDTLTLLYVTVLLTLTRLRFGTCSLTFIGTQVGTTLRQDWHTHLAIASLILFYTAVKIFVSL